MHHFPGCFISERPCNAISQGGIRWYRVWLIVGYGRGLFQQQQTLFTSTHFFFNFIRATDSADNLCSNQPILNLVSILHLLLLFSRITFNLHGNLSNIYFTNPRDHLIQTKNIFEFYKQMNNIFFHILLLIHPFMEHHLPGCVSKYKYLLCTRTPVHARSRLFSILFIVLVSLLN